MAEILLWRAAEGSWAWRYRAPGEPDVVANRTFDSREAALASARRAYPGVPVRPERRPGPAIPRWTLIAAAVVVAVVAARRSRRGISVRPVPGIRIG